jgi:hypothetical protein
MLQTLKRFALGLNLGVFASVLAHALVLAFLVVDLPLTLQWPEEQRAVEVEIVPPEEKKPPEQPQKPKAEAEQKPKPEAPKAQAPKPEAPKAAAANAEKPKPPQVLRPVVKFGEKDSGPDKPTNGDAARAASAATPAPPSKPEPVPEKPAVPVIAQEAAKPDPSALPAPQKKPAEPVKTASQMPSPSKKKGPETVTAKGDLERGIRAGQLCATELRRQLNNANPPIWPDLLPAYRLDRGNVMQVRKGAFRARDRWYNLEFRCEIDAEATAVVSLDFDVGEPVPRDEWSSRGFPEM